MSDAPDIVTRLRTAMSRTRLDVFDAAADEIERLRAERDALRGLVARLAVMAEDFRRDEQPHVDAHYPGLVDDARAAAGLDRENTNA